MRISGAQRALITWSERLRPETLLIPSRYCLVSLTLKELRKYMKVMPAEFRNHSDQCPLCYGKLKVLGSSHYGASRVESWFFENCEILNQVYTDKECFGKDPFKQCNRCACAFWQKNSVLTPLLPLPSAKVHYRIELVEYST